MYENEYEIEELRTGLFAIDDAKENSMYLIVGDRKALLVDSGMVTGKLRPLLQTLTDKPVELALTHAHGDHIYHSDEFETVYMHKEDIIAWMPSLKLVTFAGEILFGVPHKKYDIKRFIPIVEDTVFDLGGISVKTILVKGHTPGSCVFVDESHKAVFTGDAVGSGLNVWLWLPACSNIGEYRDSIEHLLLKLEPYRDYMFLGGHRKQAREGDIKHPLDIELVEHMRTLCEKIMNGEIFPSKKKYFFLSLAEYTYGSASIWTRKSKVK
jgi:glyoxylase-like metal-dependent hydrolase (beta-lactamase superfamily II)